MKGITIFLTCSLLLVIIPSWSQIDSSQTVLDEDSIVYIDDSPLVVTKTFSYEEAEYKSWFLEISGFLFKHSNFHNICDECGEYKKAIQNSLKPTLGYGGGIMIFNIGNKRKIIYSGGFSYSSFHEKFSRIDPDSSLINKRNNYDYVDLNVGLGYWLMRTKKYFSIIINTSAVGSMLVHKEGYTLDYHDVSILNINDVKRDANLVLGGRLGLKLITFNDKRLKVYIEPFSRVNFTSVLKYSDNYYLRRWSTGITFGLIYAL